MTSGGLTASSGTALESTAQIGNLVASASELVIQNRFALKRR